MTSLRRATALVLGIAALLGAAGCGSSTGSDQGTAATETGTSATTESTATTGTSTTNTAAKVSANTASAEEITAALEGVGVQNADRWTREILEYRPYDEADATLAQLRDELQKYNPAPDQLEKIISVLTP